MDYTQPDHCSADNKREYLDSIERIIAGRQAEAEQKRNEFIKEIFDRPEHYREQFRQMLGWPLVEHIKQSLPEVHTELLCEEQTHTVYRLKFTLDVGLCVSGLYFKVKGGDKHPLVIVQHGGAGTPELISGLDGSTTHNYNHMLERVICHGVHAFAPQLLLWNDTHGIPYNRPLLDAKLKRLGGSIAALEIYAIISILDYFETQYDVSTFGMVGLSYGGYYTQYTAAVDTRIRSAISCSFFNTRDTIDRTDWAHFGAAERFDDAEIACLVYPRRLCLRMGDHDELFDHALSTAAYERICRLAGGRDTDWLDFAVFDGRHEFIHDDAPIERLIRDLQLN